MIIEVPFTSKYPTIFVRLRGRNGATREYRALIDTTTDFCILPKVDAYRLGYPEAAHDDLVTTPSNLVRLASSTGYAEGMMIILEQVEIGELSINAVPFLGLDLPQATGFDVVLGRNLFVKALLKIELDFASSNIRISKNN
jgi:predicted aspartyl protease